MNSPKVMMLQPMGVLLRQTSSSPTHQEKTPQTTIVHVMPPSTASESTADGSVRKKQHKTRYIPWYKTYFFYGLAIAWAIVLLYLSYHHWWRPSGSNHKLADDVIEKSHHAVLPFIATPLAKHMAKHSGWHKSDTAASSSSVTLEEETTTTRSDTHVDDNTDSETWHARRHETRHERHAYFYGTFGPSIFGQPSPPPPQKQK